MKLKGIDDSGNKCRVRRNLTEYSMRLSKEKHEYIDSVLGRS
jgi:hypothetical protein